MKQLLVFLRQRALASRMSRSRPASTLLNHANHARLPLAVSAGLAFALSGCPQGSSLHNKDELLSCDVEQILQSCQGSLCHSSSASGNPPAGGADFFTPDFPQSLMNVEAQYPKLDRTECPDTAELIFDTAHPEQSLMLRKVLGTHSCGTGMPQPYPRAQLSKFEQQCFEAWVIEQASQSGGIGGGGQGGNTSQGGSQ